MTDPAATGAATRGKRRRAREVLASSVVLFAVMASHAVLETARDALFLTELGPQRLALAYLAIAAGAALAVTAVRRWAGIHDPRKMLVAFLGMAAAGTGVLAAAIELAPSVVFVLYVWTGLVATLIVPCFWTVLDRSMQVAEAKRAFARIGAGGVLGALVGSAIAATLASVIDVRHLVTVGAVGFGCATLAAIALAPHPDSGVAHEEVMETVDADAARRSRRLLRWLIALGVASTIALTIGDLTFKRVIAENLPADQLATAFGTIYAVLNVLGLIVQLAVAPRLLAGLGVGGTLTVLPLIVVATSAGFAATGAILAMVALKIGDGALRYSAHRVGSEILFLPVPTSMRDQSKPVVDAISQRGGQAAAAVLVFATSAFAGARTFAALTAIAGIGWLVALRMARRAYVERFSDMLVSGEVQRDVRVPDLDRQSLEMLTESLASPDEVEAIAGLDLMARYGRRIPALVLYHPHPRVVRKALSVIDVHGRSAVQRALDHLLSHSDPEIRAITLVVSRRGGAGRGAIEQALRDEHPAVRAAAVVCLADERAAAETDAAIAGLVGGTPTEQLAIARAIGYAPAPRFRQALLDLLATGDPAVMREVLGVYERAPALVDLEALIAALADPHVRNDVRRVFLAVGARGLHRLIEALEEPDTPLAVRQHLPRTIGRFRTRAAAAALVRRLVEESDATTEFRILRALGRMRTDDPTLPVDDAALRAYARRAIGDAARFATLCDYVEDDRDTTSAARLLCELLVEKRQLAIERAFRTLGILYPRSALRSVHDALVSVDEARRGAAREIVDHLIPIDLRTPLLAVLDDLPPDVRRQRLGELAPGPFANDAAFLAAILAERSESLCCVAAHHAAERHLDELREDIARLRGTAGSSLVLRAFDQAIARLDA
jgi:ATP/ADP translocase